MHIPYVIDNDEHKLEGILHDLLQQFDGRALDIASGYFNVRGFQLLQDRLEEVGTLRLLLGKRVRSGEDVGLEPDESRLTELLSRDLERQPFDEQTMRLVEDLIAFLRRDSVKVRAYGQGFLHAKCYLFFGDQPDEGGMWDRMWPLVGVVGSSNFTAAGLTSNRELNLTHRVLLDQDEAYDSEAREKVSFLEPDVARTVDESGQMELPDPAHRRLVKSEVGARAIHDLEEWFQQQWEESVDFKDRLIDILNASKFGDKKYTPYQVYMKALYEYLGDDVSESEGGEGETRSAIELTEFQEDAVKKARRILARYDGVMVADSVGLGKTWIGKKLLEDYAYHMRMKALVVCPASLRSMWKRELREARIPFDIVSQEMLGQKHFRPEDYGDVDIILVEESHNFRNRVSQRYQNLERVISLNGGKGQDGQRKKLIMLTATPINNDLMDLYNQINLITQGDQGYFAAAGIGDLRHYFLKARRDGRDGRGGVDLFNLLDEVVVRRTRKFIREAYPEARINGEKIHFPERRLRTAAYDLESTYEGIYEKIVSAVEDLHLAPYNLESYKKGEVDELEKGRQQALVGIFKSRYLKRFESSVKAFRISIHRALQFIKTFDAYLADGRLLNSSDFRKALKYLEREDEEDDAVPASRADEIDGSEELEGFLDELEEVDLSQYDHRTLRQHLQHDIDALTEIWHRVKPITPEKDAKLQRIKDLLSGELRDKKVLIFSYFKDTARYLSEQLDDEEWQQDAGNPVLHKMDSDTATQRRDRVIERFAPVSNEKSEIEGTDDEIDVLISTDVLSEGQNLQDCGYVLNYDLHWNPTKMVQRAGRCDRLGSKHDELYIYNMFPDEGLEELLGLVESLNRKVTDIDQQGLLDEPVLAGQAVNPENFNTLRRIRDEDEEVVEEEEDFAELVSNEGLQRTLQNFLDAQGREVVENLPDGIHSGLQKPGKKGMFLYFKAEPEQGEEHHFWRYYDLETGEITDNRWVIAQLIACENDTPRVVADYNVFDIQEKLIQDVLESQQAQAALEEAPAKPDPLQTTVRTILQNQMNRPDLDRQSVIAALKYLSVPMANVQVRELREAHRSYQQSENAVALLKAVLRMRETYGENGKKRPTDGTQPITRGDLRLVCFDYVCK